MARSEVDDTASATGDDAYTYDDTLTESSRSNKKGNPILKKMFASCEDDALGSVHRAWAVTVLVMVLFFVVSCIEGMLTFVGWLIAYVCVCAEDVRVIGWLLRQHSSLQLFSPMTQKPYEFDMGELTQNDLTHK